MKYQASKNELAVAANDLSEVRFRPGASGVATPQLLNTGSEHAGRTRNGTEDQSVAEDSDELWDVPTKVFRIPESLLRLAGRKSPNGARSAAPTTGRFDTAVAARRAETGDDGVLLAYLAADELLAKSE